MTGIFFPQREALRLDSRNYTPAALEKAVWAGGSLKSCAEAAKAMARLAELSISARQIHRLTRQTGEEMIEQRSSQVALHRQAEATRVLTNHEPPAAQTANPPEVVAVEMDGGRFRARKQAGGHGVVDPHWREMKVGCLLRLQSKTHKEDPHPQVPRCFLDRPRVQKLVRQLDAQKAAAGKHNESIAELLEEPENQRAGHAPDMVEMNSLALVQEPVVDDSSSESPPANTECWRPKRLVRTCVSTEQDSDAFGEMLASEAAARDFPHASRKAFLGDGQSCNWTIQATHFRDYVPIVDFVHLVSYVYAFAMAALSSGDAAWKNYVRWITMIWQGNGAEVLSEWRAIAQQLGVPETTLPDNDPLRPLQRGITYLSHNQERIDYPRYRLEGLPVTSTLVESLIKEFNYRVKGTEKFWDDPDGSEAILQVRAALLSEDDRFATHFATRPGCCYHRRSTQRRLCRQDVSTPLANAA